MCLSTHSTRKHCKSPSQKLSPATDANAQPCNQCGSALTGIQSPPSSLATNVLAETPSHPLSTTHMLAHDQGLQEDRPRGIITTEPNRRAPTEREQDQPRLQSLQNSSSYLRNVWTHAHHHQLHSLAQPFTCGRHAIRSHHQSLAQPFTCGDHHHSPVTITLKPLRKKTSPFPPPRPSNLNLLHP